MKKFTATGKKFNMPHNKREKYEKQQAQQQAQQQAVSLRIVHPENIKNLNAKEAELRKHKTNARNKHSQLQTEYTKFCSMKDSPAKEKHREFVNKLDVELRELNRLVTKLELEIVQFRAKVNGDID